jgi:cytochrome c553
MARKAVTSYEYTDDLTGEALEENDIHTVNFSYGNQDYEIDLSTKNYDELDRTLSKYTSKARRVGKTEKVVGRRRNTLASVSNHLAAVREWAGNNGYKVSPRGRISQEVLDAYNAAH